MTELCLDFSILKPKIKDLKWCEKAKYGAIKVEILAWGRGESMVAKTGEDDGAWSDFEALLT